MSKLIIRHGISEANNRKNVGKLAFASKEAPLIVKGREQARQIPAKLAQLGIQVEFGPVATSELLRTQQTAQEAGFVATRQYALLNEVEHGLELPSLRAMLDDEKLPDAAIEVARSIIENPPEEHIWFSHGLVIASLSQILNVAQDSRFIPRFCEIRELPID